MPKVRLARGELEVGRQPVLLLVARGTRVLQRYTLCRCCPVLLLPRSLIAAAEACRPVRAAGSERRLSRLYHTSPPSLSSPSSLPLLAGGTWVTPAIQMIKKSVDERWFARVTAADADGGGAAVGGGASAAIGAGAGTGAGTGDGTGAAGASVSGGAASSTSTSTAACVIIAGCTASADRSSSPLAAVAV